MVGNLGSLESNNLMIKKGTNELILWSIHENAYLNSLKYFLILTRVILNAEGEGYIYLLPTLWLFFFLAGGGVKDLHLTQQLDV